MTACDIAIGLNLQLEGKMVQEGNMAGRSWSGGCHSVCWLYLMRQIEINDLKRARGPNVDLSDLNFIFDFLLLLS